MHIALQFLIVAAVSLSLGYLLGSFFMYRNAIKILTLFIAENFNENEIKQMRQKFRTLRIKKERDNET